MAGNETSKFIALILRHKPEAIGITLDEHGWANVDDLIAGLAQNHPFSMEDLEEIVRTDDKQRYSFNEDKTLIRANQGHSIPVDVELEETEPPKYLYHGTGEKYVSSIENQGLIPKSRLYVHLSADTATADKVGSRHGKTVLYRIKAEKMFHDGYKFYLSVNGVWLTKEVPTQYFNRISFDKDTVDEIAKIILKSSTEDEAYEGTKEMLIGRYGWEYVQKALFSILLDDSQSATEYDICANYFMLAAFDKEKIRKKTATALLYYRLGNVNAPYENNTIWSFVSEVYGFDYSNSEYNPLKDEKILAKLSDFGLVK